MHSARQLGTFAGLLTLCVVLWATTPHFLTVSNLLNVLEQTALNAVVAVGMTFVIISGGIDLSVGSVLAVAGIALAVGLACGLVNGLLITVGRLPPFIATLGMMSVARGGALMMAEGRPISGFSEGFRALATERILMIPAPVIITALIYAGAQKNAGPAGVTVVIARDDMLERTPENLPVMLDYKALVAAGKETSGTSHPAILSLQRPGDSQEPLAVREVTEKEWTIVRFMGKANAGGKTQDLALEAVLVGVAKE